MINLQKIVNLNNELQNKNVLNGEKLENFAGLFFYYYYYYSSIFQRNVEQLFINLFV